VAAYRLDEMTGGWFVGAFTPAALHSADGEVGVKRYAAGEQEDAHWHEVGTEVTLVLEGTARMCGREVSAGDILVLPPGTVTGFTALTAVTTVVYKTPSVPGDKYLAEDPEVGR